MAKAITISLILLLIACGTSDKDKDYILNTPKCKIPNIEPFNSESTNITEPFSYVSCNKSELLTYVKKAENNTAILYLKRNVIPLYTSKNISCCYSYVVRNGSSEEPDVGIAISPCYHFHKRVVLEHDTVKVVCNESDGEIDNTTIYENVHHVITVKNSIKHKLRNYTEATKPLSVLFVVVDSISRLNFIRTMNKTYEFLKKNDFVEMKGYTKVADNTYPNFAALLTGLSWNKLERNCRAGEVGGLDECPMIWYDYRNKGYITAYAEDDTPISTFNFDKKGFKVPPTDYYFKPYIEASETLRIKYSHYMPYCTGPETAGERILNLAKDFAITFKNHPTFGVFWMNTFSHNDVNAPFLMDGKMKEFFVNLKDENVLDESIVIFLSDHGIRFGEIRETRTGWFEERTPINMISVPKRFQQRHSSEYANLKKNSNKLTSTYDLFMTLQHILAMSGLSSEMKPSSGCPKCTSLFKEIPESRSCGDGGIPSEWCTCMGYFRQINTTSEYVSNATSIALTMINMEAFCWKRTVWRVVSSSISESLLYAPQTKYLFIVVHTLPPDIFLLTVKFQDYVSVNSSFYIRKRSNWNFCERIVY